MEEGGVAAFFVGEVGVGLDGVAGIGDLFVTFDEVGFVLFEVEHVCQLHFVDALQGEVARLEQVLLAVGGEEYLDDGVGEIVVEVVEEQEPLFVMFRGGGVAVDEAAEGDVCQLGGLDAFLLLFVEFEEEGFVQSVGKAFEEGGFFHALAEVIPPVVHERAEGGDEFVAVACLVVEAQLFQEVSEVILHGLSVFRGLMQKNSSIPGLSARSCCRRG